MWVRPLPGSLKELTIAGEGISLSTHKHEKERTIFTQHPQQAYIAKIASCLAELLQAMQRQSHGRLMVS